MFRLAILDDYEACALKFGDWDRLKPRVEIDVFGDPIAEERMRVEQLLPYDILVIMRERTPFSRSFIEQLPNLKLLITSGPRNKAVDLVACRERGIVVCGTESGKNPPTELTWALILSVVRKITQADRETREGKWGGILGQELSGKTLGILGLGRLGTQVAQVGRAFGMEIIAWSQNLTADRAASVGAVRVEKDELFRRSDILTIHVILSARTQGLVGAHELALMKPTAFFVNTSRGPIVDEKALIAALKEGRIAGAGLDVFDIEPLPVGHPLLSLSNTVITPHVGYVTEENFRMYFKQAVEDVEAWLDGKPIRVLTP